MQVLPGLVLAVLLALIARPIAGALGGGVSAVPVAVLLGIAVANSIGVGDRIRPGLDFTVGKVLRAGIILVGLKLSLVDVVRVGAFGVPVVVLLVGFALLATLFLAERLGVGRKLGLLAAASTAICGITATLAVAPTIDADDREVAYTVANVTLLGLFGMLVYPYLAHLLFADQPGAAGLFLGTAIHDTSQVMGAALTYQELYGEPRAFEVATVAKLTRNSLLVGVVPLMGWLAARERAEGAAHWTKFVPLFVVGFLAASLVRTLGDLWAPPGWHDAVGFLGGSVAGFLLATALAAVGLKTRLSVLAGLGPRPFLVGMAAGLSVAGASLLLTLLLGSWL